MDRTLLDPATGAPLLRYTVGGATAPSAPTVLLVHGFGSDFAANWVRTGWTTALEGTGRRFVGVDLPGHGRSPKPHVPSHYSPGSLGDLLARVLAESGDGPADVVAYSMGSRLAWQLAVDHPASVRRIVLGGFGPEDAFAGTDPDRLGGEDAGPFAAVFAAAAALPGADPTALAACAKGQAREPYRPVPAPADVPVLLVAGELDPIAAGAEGLAADLAGAELLRVPRRDHRTAVSAQSFKRAAVAFLDRPDRGAGTAADYTG
ncbi:alpha/beta fold hydrolase [Nocardiopsis ansamitocini]|uniref:Alpha/beta hydrolase n=1 Tax=Nocardiopsis ansamitocini TaxID=1670832 RepID=A0A9W6UIV7_9ACTN|nr:alpha/beta hydrolase [Nocardiopsis ansamitocini]GLU47838.1 alpha/beta hydrolase [Nocardiopsis ansamitocini]